MSQPPLSLEQFDGHLPGHIKSLWTPPRLETDNRPGLKYTEAGRHENDPPLPVPYSLPAVRFVRQIIATHLRDSRGVLDTHAGHDEQNAV